MTRTELAEASTLLTDVAAAAEGDVAEKVAGLADQLATLAEADRGPDHGRLARIENGLHEAREDLSADAVDDLDRAHELVQEYRSTVDGV